MKEILNNLLWIEELLPPGIEGTPKQGGMGYYQDMKLVLILVERANSSYEHKGVTYPFDLWNGLILPVEKIRQNAFFLKYSFLENHPANKNWLYIPAESENFEEEVKQVLREVNRQNPLLGIAVKIKMDSSPSSLRKKKPQRKITKKQENSFIMSVLNKKLK